MGSGDGMDKSESTSVVGFERGEICDKKPDSKPKRYLYKVKSSTRDGLISRWMEPTSAYVNEHQDAETGEDKNEYYVGDLVNYFMFPDGRGMILGKVRKDI